MIMVEVKTASYQSTGKENHVGEGAMTPPSTHAWQQRLSITSSEENDIKGHLSLKDICLQYTHFLQI